MTEYGLLLSAKFTCITRKCLANILYQELVSQEKRISTVIIVNIVYSDEKYSYIW